MDDYVVQSRVPQGVAGPRQYGEKALDAHFQKQQMMIQNQYTSPVGAALASAAMASSLPVKGYVDHSASYQDPRFIRNGINQTYSMPSAPAIPYQMTGGNATLPPGLAQTMLMN